MSFPRSMGKESCAEATRAGESEQTFLTQAREGFSCQPLIVILLSLDEVIRMKQWLLVCLVLLLFGTTVVAMPLCNYRSPRTDISDLAISFSYHYYNDPYGFADYDIDTGQLKVDYTRLFDSPEFGFDIAAKSDITISVSSLSSFLTTAEGNFKRYFSPEVLYFGFAGASGKSASSYKTIGLEVKLGVGYGRFTDVTPLAKAMKIDAYLVKKGSISKHLDDLDLEAIAYEIDSIATYETFADLLDVLQEIIEGTGFIRVGELDALDIYEIAGIIEDENYVRYCGGDVKVGIGYELLDPLGEPNDLLGTVSFNYAFTTTPQAQFLVQGALSTLSGSYDILRTHELEITLGYNYLIAKRVTLFSSYSFSRQMWDGTPTDIHSLSLDLVLTPVEYARVTLGIQFRHEPYFLEWSQDIELLISMDLL